MKHIILGTAGHIDHGKTLLVKALTGVDTDRLPEEKKRGITIDLGFAALDEGDIRIGVVDVPGHEKFIKNMIAGASGIDMVLLVVAADDGVMPQTREHFDVVRLLGASEGLVVVTKIDLVDDETRELIREELEDMVRGSFLEGKPMVDVSAKTGEGVDAVRKAVFEGADRVRAREAMGPFRLPIDRAFILEGIGTVVTGTIVSGSVRPGDEVVILPGEVKARVRSVQVHGADVEGSEAGTRTAINLPRIPRDDLDRGQVLASPGFFRETYMLDGRIHCLPTAPKPLGNNKRVRLLSGAFSVVAKVVLLEADELEPGRDGLVQFRTETPVVCERGDRFIVRELSPEITVGGGLIIDAHPQKHRRKRPETIEMLKLAEQGRPEDRLELVLKQAGYSGASPDALARDLGLKPAEIEPEAQGLVEAGRAVLLEAGGKRRLYYFGYYRRIMELILAAAAEHHRKRPFAVGMGKEELKTRLPFKLETAWLNEFLNLLAREQRIRLSRDRVSLPEHKVEFKGLDAEMRDALLDALEAEPFSPPDIPALCADKRYREPRMLEIAAALVDQGLAVRLTDTVFMSRPAVDRALALLREHFQTNDGITPSELRVKLDSTRKYVMPLLEYFDANGVTRRVGDERKLLG